MALEVDPLLDVLAMAETGSGDQFAEVLQAAHPVTAPGGLVLAVVTDLDEELARRVASLRQPGGTALAIVLDPHGFSANRRRGGGGTGPDGLACVSVLQGAGWSVAVVGATDGIAPVWSSLSATGHRVGVA
jgi:hypothetical protein